MSAAVVVTEQASPPTGLVRTDTDVRDNAVVPWHVPPALDPQTFAAIRRRTVLAGYKWDPQVGDVSTLAPFPLVLRADVWRQLATWSESLTAEALAAEAELIRRPELHRRLALPRPVRRLFAQAARPGGPPPTPAGARVMRFDFHWTTGGWQISEVNSDVPGGYAEAGGFTALIAEHYPGTTPTGDPAEALADAVAAAARRAPGSDSTAPAVALLCAAGFMEDQQVVSYLAARLRARGLHTFLADPRQLRWQPGERPHSFRASLETDAYRGPLAAVVRFYQGEWLAGLPRRCGWARLFVGGATPVVNPGVSLLSESKRFPLTWDELSAPVPTWRVLLPETRDPRHAPWRRDGDRDGWLLKSAFCNTGDTVAARAWVPARRWRRTRWSARLNPRGWVAQRRFEPVAADTPRGPMYPCVGVYTVDGRAAGAYGRLSSGPVVDFAAVDVAVLMERSGAADA